MTGPRDQVGSTQLEDSEKARQTGVLLVDIEALLEQAVTGAMYAHGERAVDLRWVQRENSGTEGHEIVRRREALLVACDPPWLVSQTPTRIGIDAVFGGNSIIVEKIVVSNLWCD